MIRGKRSAFGLLVALAALLGIAAVPASVWAQAVTPQASSATYSIDEAYFGTGGQLCDTANSTGISANYCAGSSVGETAVGAASASGGSQNNLQGGQNTKREESLTLVVNNTNADLGVLSPGSASKTTGTFTVKSYLSGGYVVVNGSNPPTSSGTGSHVLTAIAPSFPATSASSPGTEQFGINLVSNGTVSGSADPVQDGTFGFGAAASGYNTTNQFRYAKGETIASSAKESGTTTYTVSYLYNISNTTPAGLYTFNHVIIATPTF